MALILSPPGQFRGSYQQQLQQCYRYLFIQNQQLNAALHTLQTALDTARDTVGSGEAPADHLIAQKQTGGWHYRKWHSGLCECWGSVTGSISVAESCGGVYTSAESTLSGFPRIFTALASVQLTPEATQLPYWVSAVSGGLLPAFRLLSPTAQTINYHLNVYCQGTWK